MKKGMNSVFITGTDTGVGKTRVSCVLMRQLIGKGLRVVGMKPVASGAETHSGRLRNEDALQLIATSNVDAPYEWVNPYSFAPPIAPHIAAQQAGVSILPEVIYNAYKQLAAIADVVVVEGVGGWRVPIDASKTMADIAQMLNLPVIMVVGMRLGCLNHAQLTAQSIQASSQQFAGWVANIIDPRLPALQENLDTLKEVLKIQLLGVLDYGSQTLRGSAM